MQKSSVPDYRSSVRGLPFAFGSPRGASPDFLQACSTLPALSHSPHQQHNAIHRKYILLWLIAVRICHYRILEHADQGSEVNLSVTESLTNFAERDVRLMLCDNSDVLGNPYKLRSFKTLPLIPCHSAIIMLMLFQCGDLELNPGPGVHTSTVYPCGFCELKVSWSHKAVCCDDCSMWYHIVHFYVLR